MGESELVIGDRLYRKAAYVSPATGYLYLVRDKRRGNRIIRVVDVSEDGAQVQVEIVEEGKPATGRVALSVDSLSRQAARGWCSLLLPAEAEAGTALCESSDRVPPPAESMTSTLLRLDIQNFSRCCSDIARANIRFDTQLIKDVGDGPFRAGNYEQAFVHIEQIAVGFTSAVSASRRAIADGRRALTAQKGKLSGKEIEERKAAFVRSEQLVGSAERSFATIVEGLRVYLRTKQG